MFDVKQELPVSSKDLLLNTEPSNQSLQTNCQRQFDEQQLNKKVKRLMRNVSSHSSHPVAKLK